MSVLVITRADHGLYRFFAATSRWTHNPAHSKWTGHREWLAGQISGVSISVKGGRKQGLGDDWIIQKGV